MGRTPPKPNLILQTINKPIPPEPPLDRHYTSGDGCFWMAAFGLFVMAVTGVFATLIIFKVG
jgi:hypothetical protein